MNTLPTQLLLAGSQKFPPTLQWEFANFTISQGLGLVSINVHSKIHWGEYFCCGDKVMNSQIKSKTQIKLKKFTHGHLYHIFRWFLLNYLETGSARKEDGTSKGIHMVVWWDFPPLKLDTDLEELFSHN